jgi:hypothetical protein
VQQQLSNPEMKSLPNGEKTQGNAPDRALKWNHSNYWDRQDRVENLAHLDRFYIFHINQFPLWIISAPATTYLRLD